MRSLIDTELNGQKIKEGDRIVLWYISTNRDASAIDNADKFIIYRSRCHKHLSFGAGIHGCVGDRLVTLQLRILWEEIVKENLAIEVVGQPVRQYSNFIRGILHLPVHICA